MDDFTPERFADALLTPVSDSEPAGEDLRGDASAQSLYFRLRDARAEARAAERQADNDPDLAGGVPPQWNLVADLATEALESRSKDIEIACWLVESLTRHQGLVGFADGAELLGGLVTAFWPDELYPAPEEDDPEARLAAITGLSGQDRDGSLLQPLRKTVLFARPDGTPITLWDYERSSNLAALGGKPEAGKAAAGVIPFAELEADARGVGLEALREVARETERAEASWKALEAAIADKVPAEAQPSTGRVRALIESLRQITRRYVPAGPVAAPEPDPQAADLHAPDPAAASPDAQAAPRRDREALLDEILRIAGVFRRSEPNSPIGFTLEEAVRRARMPWPDLLHELVADGAARATMMSIAGLKAEGPAAES